jgi:hypothetical protein
MRDLLHTATFDLARAEFGIALTFCQLASGAEPHSDKRLRNVRNAHEAYRGALKAMRKIHLTQSERSSLMRMDKLVTKALLDLMPNGGYTVLNKERPRGALPGAIGWTRQ